MKKILIGVLALIIVGGIYFATQYFKPHKNIETAKEDVSITAPNLFSAFSDNEAKANTDYLDKIILVSGEINEVTVDDSSNVNVYLNVGNDGFGSVSCNFSSEEGQKALNYKNGQVVKIKGVCTGFLMDVVLNKCILVD
ncbi:MAG: OB-fold putative lipoprotein [Bacteroidia bacterium]|nr:OB-fold putative lipoprotein [Bacteroidia bacterium]